MINRKTQIIQQLKGVKDLKVNYTLKRMLSQLVARGYLVEYSVKDAQHPKGDNRWEYILEERCMAARSLVRRHWTLHAVFTLKFKQVTHIIKKQHGYSETCASLVVETLIGEGSLWSDSDDRYGCCLMEVQPSKRETFYKPMTY
jgi:hypothetical protein